MATLQKIRNRAGLLISVVIGVSLLAFVLQDFLTSGQSMFRGKQMEIARVSGKSLNIEEYNARVDQLTEIYKLNTGREALDEATTERIRQDTWQQMIQDAMMGDSYKDLGIEVSADELFDMVQGNDPHPTIRSIFTNPETGLFNKSALLQFLKNMDQDPTGNQKIFWLYIEKEISKERSQQKYQNLVSKGLFANSVQAENEYKESARRVDISYVVNRYANIADSTVEITDADLKAYLKAHKEEFKQDASRDIAYITFDVLPSADDFKSAQDFIGGVKEEFVTAENPEEYVNLNSDEPFQDRNLAYSDLTGIMKDTLYNARKGEVVGPYFENMAYKLSRVIDITQSPDSVKARHILIQPSQTLTLEQAKVKADSIKGLIDKGADFTALAIEFSDDKGSAREGGDLGWFREGMMVKEFNDVCFNNRKGTLKTVETQFGVHIIEITDLGPVVKKVKIGTIERKVEPSKVTYQAVYSRASKFAGNNRTREAFDNAAANEKLNVQMANSLRESDQRVANMEQSRPLVKWAYTAEVNDVSEIFEFGDQFVVATLTSARKEGYATIDDRRADLEVAVRREKKAQKMMTEMASSDLDELSAKIKSSIETASGISFSSYSLPNGGREPKVIATASMLPKDQVSKPIDGQNGVYVIKVTNEVDSPNADSTFMQQRYRLNMMYGSRAGYETQQALQEMADIRDYRIKFY